MKRLSLLTISIISFVFSFTYAEKADFVIFSFDRPMQLYALLESTEKYVTGLHEVMVIYRASTEDFAQAYQSLFSSFSSVHFFRQGENPHEDFKALTLLCAFGSPSPYVLFGVDDIIVKDYVNVESCIESLKKHNAYGFFLRLGEQLTECYSMNSLQPLPPFRPCENDVLSWYFNKGIYDWGYPHTVDMTIYAKKDIRQDLHFLFYHSPNTLEAQWARRTSLASNQKGLCFRQTKIVNIPLNRVQQEWANRYQNAFTVQELLEWFDQGFVMDIEPLYRIQNKSAHMEYDPVFVTRSK